MQSTMLSTGNPIEARCTKCRKNTTHIIIELVEEVPAKVQCSACSREHKYRPPTEAKKPGVRKAVQAKDAGRKEWQALRTEMDTAKAATYSMTGAFKIKTLIQHPTFGLGLVQRAVGPQKIEVLFEDGTKTMRCK